MVGLLVFSGSQAPLPVRYPHPTKPRLALPPLVHRSLHTALDAQPPSALFQDDLLFIPQPGTLAKHTPESDHDVTVKVQVESGASSALGAITEALQTLAQHKGLSTIDTALVGLPPRTSQAEWMEVWKAVTGGSMCVKQWGTIGLTEEQLSEISNVRAPVVNELNVTDCTTLPKDYTTFAKSKGIHLWASGGAAGPEPLPAADLHNLLQEFRPKIAALAPSVNTAGLSQLIAVLPDGESYEPSAPGVKVRWVLSYTLVSRARNIVKDKGYIVAADFA